MEPEIARRCLSCGASVRGRAYFCPQCGLPMSEGAARAREAAATDMVGHHPLAEEAERVAASLSNKLADAPATELESSADDHAGARAVEESAARQPVVTPEATTRAATSTADALPEAPTETDEVRAGGATPRSSGPRGGVRGRAAAVGATVGGSLKPRVERLREASSVVIDEAADDPGVRFLVVAAVLFLLFLLLWLLSFTLG